MTTLPLACGCGLFTAFGVKLAVLNRASTGIQDEDRALDMVVRPEPDLFVDLVQTLGHPLGLISLGTHYFFVVHLSPISQKLGCAIMSYRDHPGRC